MELTELLLGGTHAEETSARFHPLCKIDDFCQDWLVTFSSTLFPAQGNNLPKYCRMTLSEVMTIAIHFHQSKYRTFKDYYLKHVCVYLVDYRYII
jgi:hypothetical protein